MRVAPMVEGIIVISSCATAAASAAAELGELEAMLEEVGGTGRLNSNRVIPRARA